MTTVRITVNLCMAWTLGSCCAVWLFGQGIERPPHPCGADTADGLPTNLSVIADPSQGHAEMLFNKLGTHITFPGVMNGVQETCKLADNRLVVFGMANEGLYNIAIISQASGTLLDSFYGFNALLAPNKRWLIRRKFYPGGVATSEEYLLYDTTKSAVENRAPSVTKDDMDAVGVLVYPVGENNKPFENVNLPVNETHVFRSGSFYWDPESRVVAFADSVQDDLVIVFLAIEPGGVRAYVHHVTASEVCGSSVGSRISSSILTLVDAKIARIGDAKHRVELGFRSADAACQPETMTLGSWDFEAANPEIRAPRPARKPSRRVDR